MKISKGMEIGAGRAFLIHTIWKGDDILLKTVADGKWQSMLSIAPSQMPVRNGHNWAVLAMLSQCPQRVKPRFIQKRSSCIN